MIPSIHSLNSEKKVFFASDFHLGVPTHQLSIEREKKIIRWLKSIEDEASAIFLVGDIFDFWFEYKYTIPKGFIRIQGKLAELRDKGIPIYMFTGNHDMWMFSYFSKELGIPIFREPQEVSIAGKKFLVGHGDGLGPGDYVYKVIKQVFANRLCQWVFSVTPSWIGMGIAHYWSKRSRLANNRKKEEFLGDQEWLLQYCKQIEKDSHFDYYIFGHRHLPLDIQVTDSSRYINLGEWVNFSTYAVFDGSEIKLAEFEKL